MIRTTVQGATEMPEWEIAEATTSGTWRFNAALRYARDKSSYPYSLQVVIPAKRAGPRQHGAADQSTEEEVIAAVAGQAVLVGVCTSRDDRRFQFYTGSADWTARLQGQLRTTTGSGTLRVYCGLDANWMTYRDLRGRPEAGLKHLVLALVCPTLIVPWVMVKDAYGQAWSKGEIAALVIVVAAFWLPREYLQWFPRHPVLILAARAGAVSAVLLFPLLALTRVPAWIGLVASLPAGAALVAGVQVARSITGRAIARRVLGAVPRPGAPVLRDERLR